MQHATGITVGLVVVCLACGSESERRAGVMADGSGGRASSPPISSAGGESGSPGSPDHQAGAGTAGQAGNPPLGSSGQGPAEAGAAGSGAGGTETGGSETGGATTGAPWEIGAPCNVVGTHAEWIVTCQHPEALCSIRCYRGCKLEQPADCDCITTTTIDGVTYTRGTPYCCEVWMTPETDCRR